MTLMDTDEFLRHFRLLGTDLVVYFIISDSDFAAPISVNMDRAN